MHYTTTMITANFYEGLTMCQPRYILFLLILFGCVLVIYCSMNKLLQNIMAQNNNKHSLLVSVSEEFVAQMSGYGLGYRMKLQSRCQLWLQLSEGLTGVFMTQQHMVPHPQQIIVCLFDYSHISGYIVTSCNSNLHSPSD